MSFHYPCPEQKLTLKYYPKLKVFKSANVSFDPETMIARSYDWWQFVRVINDQVVFNNYRYSVTTARHQRKMKALLAGLGIAIDLEIETRSSLGAPDALETAIRELDRAALELHAGMITGTRDDNWNRVETLEALRLKQDRIERLMKQAAVAS